MTNKKLSEGVGKKIVEALKKQSEIEINPASSSVALEDMEETQPNYENQIEASDLDALFGESDAEYSNPKNQFSNEESVFEADEFQSQVIPPQPQASMNHSYNTNNINTKSSFNDSLMNELDNFEIPGNIAVLKKLINQLPTGVNKHTGAQIIKQTMEALGISMKSVLQEAQQVQEGLNNSGKECYNTIQEYKRQILTLEKQAQSYQKQYSALNELISLFIQTGV